MKKIVVMFSIIMLLIPSIDVFAATKGEQNALKAVAEYLEDSPMSESSVRDYLDWDGYTSSEIEYAIKNCNVDWNEQAVKYAKKELSEDFESKESLKSSLEGGGFTESQVEYALEACKDTDWNEQALLYAKRIIKE